MSGMALPASTLGDFVRSLGVVLSCFIAVAPLFAAEPARDSVVAHGEFAVNLLPDGEPATADGVSLGRMTLDKSFTGDLAGTSKGTMLTALTGTQGSAGYVAIERVTGTLNGKKGSFVFQHSGTMNRGAQQLSISVVPDSGTGELAGIEGTFTLTITEGKHLYEFAYSLPK